MFARRLPLVVAFSLAAAAATAQTSDVVENAASGNVPFKPARSPFDPALYRDFVTYQLSQPQPGVSLNGGRDLRTVQGQVVDHLGQTIAGALVSITEQIGLDNESFHENFDRTDALGRFVVTSNQQKDRVVVSRSREDSWNVTVAPGQTYLKFVWPTPNTLRLELDLNLCPAGKKFYIYSAEYWAGMEPLRIGRDQPDDGVTTLTLLPGSFRLLSPKRIEVGEFEVERWVEVAHFTLGEGQERTLHVTPEAGIAITNTSAERVAANQAAAVGRFVEIRTMKTRYHQVDGTVDIVPVDADGQFRARVLAPGQYVMQTNFVTPREAPGGRGRVRGEEAFETQAAGKFRFVVKEGDKEVDIARPMKGEAVSPSVQRVHWQLDSEGPREFVSWSHTDVQVAGLAADEGRKEMVAELLRIYNDENAPYEWIYPAVQALGKMTATEGVVEGLLAALDVPFRKWERYSVMYALQNPERMVPEVIYRLAAMTNDKEQRYRAGAYLALEQIGGKQPKYRETISPLLIKGLADPYDNIRSRNAATLGWYEAANAEEPLQKLLEDPDQKVRLAASQALWKITQDKGPLVRIATELLSHENLSLRIDAAYQLESLDNLPPATITALRANLGPEMGPGMDRIRDRLRALRSDVSQAARRALKKHNALDEGGK